MMLLDNNPMLRDGITGDWYVEQVAGVVRSGLTSIQDRDISWPQGCSMASTSV